MHTCNRWMRGQRGQSRSSMIYSQQCRSQSGHLRISLGTLRNNSTRYSLANKITMMKIIKTKKDRLQMHSNLPIHLIWILRMKCCHQRELLITRTPNSQLKHCRHPNLRTIQRQQMLAENHQKFNLRLFLPHRHLKQQAITINSFSYLKMWLCQEMRYNRFRNPQELENRFQHQ